MFFISLLCSWFHRTLRAIGIQANGGQIMDKRANPNDNRNRSPEVNAHREKNAKPTITMTKYITIRNAANTYK